MEHRLINLLLPKIHHPPGAVCFMQKYGRRPLVFRPSVFAAQHGESVQHASREGFEAACFPRLRTRWQIERGLAIKAI